MIEGMQHGLALRPAADIRWGMQGAILGNTVSNEKREKMSEVNSESKNQLRSSEK